ncbi:MAG: hypothetical protein HUK40_18840 [Desulfobacter sp.]|nr:hypothetical protein [Desulfobacter sp.]WDP86696.1 MAG: hypothetical protein HUN05_17480 [Desulfobacter sp.]
MSYKFASIELARLYETQGYLQDALDTYKKLDDDVLKGGAEVRAAVKRVEMALDGNVQKKEYSEPKKDIQKILALLNQDAAKRFSDSPLFDREKIARLMEKWLMLMVVQKRVQSFKAISKRL